MPTTADAVETARVRPLWRERNFARFWAAQAISVFGDQISLLALPLAAVLTLDASPAQMGVLTALVWLPHLVFSLFVGVWIDRRRERRRVMVFADIGRAAVLVSVPIAAALDALTIGQLYVVTFAVGSLSVLFDLAYSSAFVSVVPRDRVLEANGKLMTTRALSYVGGPSLSGGLVQLLTAPIAILADALSFVVSAVLLRSIDSDEPPVEREPEATARSELIEGGRFLLRHPVLRAGIASAATVNFFNFVLWSIFVLYATRELDLSPGVLGLIFGVGGLGGVIGAMVGPYVGRRLGLGPGVVIGAILFPLPLLLFPLAGGPTWLVVSMLIVGEFLSSVGVMLYDVNLNSLNVLTTPHRLRSRTVGAGRFVNYGTRPIGALLGGFLGTAIGLRETLWIGAIGGCLCVLWLLASPVPRIREAPVESA